MKEENLWEGHGRFNQLTGAEGLVEETKGELKAGKGMRSRTDR